MPEQDLSGSTSLLSYFQDIVSNVSFDVALSFILTFLAIIAVYVPPINQTVLRVALSLVLVFIPGYSMVAALFPAKSDMGWMERLFVSFGISLVILPSIGIILNFTPLGVRLETVTLCIAIFIVVCLLATYKRRHELSQDERFDVKPDDIYRAIIQTFWRPSEGAVGRTLAIVLLISAVISVCTLAYVTITPNSGERFTELYILGPNDKAYDYPLDFTQGEQKNITVVVSNHELRGMPYDLIVMLNNSSRSAIIYSEHMNVSDNETWKKAIQVKPDVLGTNIELDFRLYADGNMVDPYRECHLWINVLPVNASKT